jgi:signal transduction histidine kinase
VLANAAAKPLLELVSSKDARVVAHYQCDGARDESSCASCLFDPRRPPRSCIVDSCGRVLEIHATPLPPGEDGRRGRVLLARDITDRVEQDERQIHQERLSVLGEVAAVMAHEINNPLAAIRMFAQMAEQGLPPESPYREHLGVIRRNTENCSRAIRELLDYATGAAPEVGEVDLHAVLEDAAHFVRPVAERTGARVRLDLAAALPTLSGDEIQLRQVFVNLVMNALQAMGARGGEVVLATRDDGAHVVVDVIDDGPGVPPDLVPRIFEPFFTTKRRGAGTGLGLPTARRIAELHGGGLELAESRPGRTVFRVRLRRSRLDSAPVRVGEAAA